MEANEAHTVSPSRELEHGCCIFQKAAVTGASLLLKVSGNLAKRYIVCRSVPNIIRQNMRVFQDFIHQCSLF